MKTLETDRLTLRSWTLDDLDDFYEYAKDPDIGPSAGWPPHESREDSLRILQSFIEKDEVWAIVMKEDGKAVGSIGLHADQMREGVDAKMVGYVLAKAYWGQGLMTEAVRRVIRYAFEELGLEVLSVYHFAFNDRSRRVIEKCGFVREGTLRRARRLIGGGITDDVCYSILREEYLGTQVKR